MRQLLLQLAAQGKTLIVTSHILPELARICNVVAIVTHGKLRAFGSVDDVMSKLCPQRNYEVQLTNSDAMKQGEQVLQGLLHETEPISVSAAELTLRFPTVRSEAELSEVLQRLVAAKVPVAQFREVTSDLEDAFLSVAGKD
jgi:ABC-2 type transport system ATP-binding protein